MVLAAMLVSAAVPGSAPEAGAPPLAQTEAALAEAERKHGFLHPSTMALRATLVGLYRMTGQYDNAEAVLLREIATLEAAEGRSSLRLAAPLNRLAGVYRRQDRKTEADALLRRALVIYDAERERQPRAEAPVRPAVPRPLPVSPPVSKPVVREAPRRGLPPQVKPPAAAAAVVESVAARQMSPEARDGFLARAARLDAAADMLWWQEDMTGVESRRREALELRMAVLGPDHSEVADSLVRLARFLLATGREAEGVAHFRRAIEIKRRGEPAEATSLAEARWELASLYLARGDYSTAAPLMARALDSWRRSAAIEPVRLAAKEAAYAALLQQLGRAGPAQRAGR